MISELISVLGVIVGAGGLLGIALKRTWDGADRADAAFLEGWAKRGAQHLQEIAELRAEFNARLAAMEERHQRELDATRNHVNNLHAALAELVQLVAPEHLPEATAILVRLGVPPSTIIQNGDNPHEHR